MSADPSYHALVRSAPATVDSRATAICRDVGHVFEGRLIAPRVIGRCQRCGVGILSDGSEATE